MCVLRSMHLKQQYFIIPLAQLKPRFCYCYIFGQCTANYCSTHTVEGDPDFATSCYYIQCDHIFTKSRLILNTLLIKGHFGNSLSELLKISISTEAMCWNSIYNGKVLGSCWIGGTKDQFVSKDLLQLQPDHSNSVARCNKPDHTHESRISP